jgi:GTP-binding protein
VIIRSVEYVGSIGAPGGAAPGTLPQIAFSGRSNVGKSSLINTLLRRTRKKIAHVSSTPGKTRTVNFFSVNDEFYLVDLPGFGFAKVSQATRESWKALIESYLSGEPGPRGVVHLVDARHDPAESDREMMAYLGNLGLPTLLVLTKIDKVGRGHRSGLIQKVSEDLGLDTDQIVFFSSKTGEGREELLEAVEDLLEE